MNKKLGISVIIATYNSELWLKECLESVKWADEIIIVDMNSEDKTISIAKHYTNKIFFVKRIIGFPEPSFRLGLEKASNNWILIFASDELIPFPLKKKIEEIIENNLADIVYIPRKNFFFGKLMKGAGWGYHQDKHPRLFKKSFVEINEELHNTFKIKKEGRIIKLLDSNHSIIHFNFIDVEHFLFKINSYTTVEAKEKFKKGIKVTMVKTFLQAFKEFIGRFFIRGGYKDGFQGFYLSFLMAAYNFSIKMKYDLLVKFDSLDSNQKIIEKYKKIAQHIITAYKS